ncbi:MAG: CBS domain-containing protein [Chloroflexota bacterium]
MTGRYSLARQTPVSACQQRLAIEMLLVGADDDLLVVMRRSAEQPQTRLIGVIGEDGKMVGVLPIHRLAESVVSRVAPEALLSDISGAVDVARFGHSVEARVVRDVMVEPAVVQPEVTIDHAFRQMRVRRLSGLYVVDADGRPTGYLDLLELVLMYVDALESSPPAPSG